MQSILNLEGSLSTLLKEEKNREKVARKTIKMGFVDNDDFDELMSILERLYVCHAAYVLHRARNVFNATYADWWEMAGECWNQMGR